MSPQSYNFSGALAHDPSVSAVYAIGSSKGSIAIFTLSVRTASFINPNVIEDAQSIIGLHAGHGWIVAIAKPWRLVIYQSFQYFENARTLLLRLRLWLPALLHLPPQTANTVAVSASFCSVLYGQTFVLRFDDEPLVTVACAQGILETFFINVTDSQRLSQVVIDQDVASDSLAVVADQEQPTILWVSFHVCGAAHAEVRHTCIY
jgi:hypothetical protein